MAYRGLKYDEEVLKIHSRKAANVQQEIFAHLLHHNYTQLLVNYAEEVAVKSAHLMYEYEANFSAAVATTRMYLNGDKLEGSLEYTLWHYRCPIRPDRAFFRHMRAKPAQGFQYRGPG